MKQTLTYPKISKNKQLAIKLFGLLISKNGIFSTLKILNLFDIAADISMYRICF